MTRKASETAAMIGSNAVTTVGTAIERDGETVADIYCAFPHLIDRPNEILLLARFAAGHASVRGTVDDRWLKRVVSWLFVEPVRLAHDVGLIDLLGPRGRLDIFDDDRD